MKVVRLRKFMDFLMNVFENMDQAMCGSYLLIYLTIYL